MFFVCICTYSMVFKDERNLEVKFDIRRSLEPFKDLDSRFDPSSTAMTKRSQTLSHFKC